MKEFVKNEFIIQINQNMGIIHKVCSIYFKNTEDAKDVKQEMLYQLWKSYPSFLKQAKFTTWMYRVSLNTAITCLKKNKKNKYEVITEYHQEVADQITEPMDEEIYLLHRAIDKLSPINKIIILLYLEELSYDEMVEITGLSKTNISVKLVRIKKELKINIKEINNNYYAEHGTIEKMLDRK